MSGETAEKPIKDASTVIVLREAGGTLETFMLCRHHRSGFMSGAHVFPGGKVDDADATSSWIGRIDRSGDELSAALGESDATAALGLLVAAVRETFEESGVLLASAAADADIAGARARLLDGAPFAALAAELDLKIEATKLTPYARWITPKMESRRFDTRFYVAVVPEGQTASHDGTETTSAAWMRPTDAIEEMHAGRIKLAPPTVRTLHWLTGFKTTDAVIDDALSRTPPLIRPRLVTGDEGWFLALPGDPKHPEDEPALPGATRMVLDGTAWKDAL